jgi:transcription antitermination factor NusG
MANWYVIYTRAGCETKVAEILSRKLIENYCPVVRSVKKVNNVKKLVHEPLFSSYVFVRMNTNDLPKLKSIDRIINVVYWLQKPAIIKDIEIEMIKRFLNVYKNIQLEKTEVKLNEIVKIGKEPYIDEQKKEISLNYSKVRLSLPSLGYAIVAIAETDNVALVTNASLVEAVNGTKS